MNLQQSFDPAAVQMLSALVSEIEAEFARKNRMLTEAERQMLAARVFRCASDGEADPRKIKERVLHTAL